jgi:cob(I)alamin adenosyltransferase
MGHRLSKIYTRTGDDGTTGLGDGTRVPKDHARVEAFGAVDELNSAIGLLLTEPLPDDIHACLTDVQNTLFDLGGELSIPGYSLLTEHRVTALEQVLDELNSQLPPLKEFILPGGTRAAALCHSARAVCRRAERRVFTLLRDAGPRHLSLIYLNRLSDLLFVIARSLNKTAGEPETLWRRTPTDS